MTFNLESKELNPLEQAFKKLFHEQLSRHLDTPCSQAEVMDILTAVCSKTKTAGPFPLDNDYIEGIVSIF